MSDTIILNRASFDTEVDLCKGCAGVLQGTVMGNPGYTSTSAAMDTFFYEMCAIGVLIDNYATIYSNDIAALEAAGAALDEADASQAGQFLG